MPDTWREPARIGQVLLGEARRWGLDNPVEISKVFGSWREIVGEQVADRCEPASLARGVLKVSATSAPWANELKYLAPEVIRRVNAGVGRELVRELKVTLRPAPGGPAGRGAGPRRKAAQGAVGGPGVGSSGSARRSGPGVRLGPAMAEEELDKLVEPIGDERLAAATKRAALAAKTRREPPNSGG